MCVINVDFCGTACLVQVKVVQILKVVTVFTGHGKITKKAAPIGAAFVGLVLVQYEYKFEKS